MSLKSTITAPPVIEGVTQVNSDGDTIIATPVVLIDKNGEFASLSGGGGSSAGLTDTQLRATPVPVSMSAALPGLVYESTATIIRAANTTAYTASATNFDVYGGLFQLQNIGEAGKGIFLSYFEISLNLSAVPQGMTSFAVHLYPTAPTIIADNNIWTIGSDPVLDPIGFNVSMSLAKGGGKVVGVIKDLNQLFILTSSSLWGYLVTNGAFTPSANSEEGTIRARSFAP